MSALREAEGGSDPNSRSRSILETRHDDLDGTFATLSAVSGHPNEHAATRTRSYDAPLTALWSQPVATHLFLAESNTTRSYGSLL